MKKRLICLSLCLLLLLPAVLAGCKKQTDIEEKFQQTATTLSMWVVTENADSVSEEAKKIVSAKLDEITKDRFKVHLIVNYISADVYRETLDNEIRGFYETRAHVTPRTDDQKTAETEVNEWGITVIKYPALLDHQVDIIYIEGEEMFKTYAKEGWLASLNAELNGNSKAIRSNVNGSLLNAASYEGQIYAVPNNHTLGEYTVMLLNKELMAETWTDAVYRQGKIDGLFNDFIYTYLEEVKAKGDESILPVNASYSECLNLLAYFWNIDPNTLENEGGLSILGYRYEDLSEISRSVPLSFNNLFSDPEFTKAFLKLKQYQYEGGFFGEADGEKKVALSIETMGYEELTAYRAADSEYYPVILKNPTLFAEDVYGSMFAVCSQTESLEYSMKVLTLLNTNAEFRNVLQYGVENKTYQLVPDPMDNQKKTVAYSTEIPYHMDIFKTGNAFLAYPEPEMDENIWENGKAQNRDVSGADPTLDLDFRSIALETLLEDTEDLNTQTCLVRLNDTLLKSSISSNPVIWQWFTANCKSAENGSIQVLQSQKELANGKTKYTYLAYIPGLEYGHTLSVETVDQNGQLTVRMDYNDTSVELYELDEKTGKTVLKNGVRSYALWLITAEAGETVEGVKFALYRNGLAAEATVFVPETDPDFTYLGTLNSELVRYLYDLNAKLVEKIEACTNLEELSALLGEIKYLLTPHTDSEWIFKINEKDNQENPVGYQAEAAKYVVLSDLVETLDLEEVNYAVILATSTAYTARKDTTEDDTGKTIVADMDFDYRTGEEIEQLDSPFALYYAWLRSNGYYK